MERLKEILKTMDLPPKRIEMLDEYSLRWLKRNIHFRNQQHPNFKEAVEIIAGLLQ